MSERARLTVLIGIVATFIAGASTVFVVGSTNRRNDKGAVLRYEASIIAQMREMTVVAGSLEDAADAVARGRLPAAAFAASATQFQKTLSDVAERINAVRVPAPFGAGEKMFAPAAAEYAKAASLYATACAQNSVGPTSSCLAPASASTAAQHALSLYLTAVRVLQDTRTRLGLGRSANFPLELPR